MRKQILCITLPICAAILVAGAWLSKAGDINPPPGPVNPTMVTLDEIFNTVQALATDTRTPISSLPFTIDQCGSYFLTACLTGVAGENGITIDVGDVTLDLNGFALIGVVDSLDGITVPAFPTDNITIKNGTIRDWGEDGIDAFSATNSQLRDLRASNNGRRGLMITFASLVTDCTASGNGWTGIFTTDGCTVVNCAARDNGIDGISVGASCTVRGCSTFSNNVRGINVTASTTVVNCAANANGQEGIRTTAGSTVLGCSVRDNTGNGIDTATGCTIRNCSAFSNGGDGFTLSQATTISGCTASGNAGDGIEASTRCLIIGNTCDRSGSPGVEGAGIHTIGGGNRIEGNNVMFNDRGIDASGVNIIIKNTARDNTINYDVGGSHYGEVIINPGPGFISTNPWANFEF